LAFLDTESAKAVAPRVIELMGKELNWSEDRKKKELQETNYFLHIMTVGKEADQYNDDEQTTSA
jgi:glycerol-3-phosphate dehydrogenase